MKKKKELRKGQLEPGTRVEIVRKGQVRHSGAVLAHRWDDDAGAWTSDVEILTIEVDDLGPRSFSREVSARGQADDWRAKAQDMRRIGGLSIRRVAAPGERVRGQGSRAI
jgi:hypothetical protein